MARFAFGFRCKLWFRSIIDEWFLAVSFDVTYFTTVVALDGGMIDWSAAFNSVEGPADWILVPTIGRSSAVSRMVFGTSVVYHPVISVFSIE